MDSAVASPVLEKSCWKKSPLKAELEASDDDDKLCSLSKRPKLDLSNQGYNPLEEPSPLGLKLKKSPSFLDLIQMKLSQEKSAPLAKTLPRKEKGSSANADKLKASNFPASLLKIGTWEYKSRYEGDLVAKCYFAKHKLVWEVLDGGLKNKIEIQWSDIMAIKANYPDDGLETLDVLLARQPLFFREINPQPRKHTLWQAASDFTSGQATIYRRHFLLFPQGTLGKHFEKLMQCDHRLRFLSQQPEIVLDTPYFQPMVSIFGDQSVHGRNLEWKTEMTPSFSDFRDTITTSGFSCSDIENPDLVVAPPEHNSHRSAPIPEMFRMDGDPIASNKITETHTLSLLNHVKLPGIRPSMSVSDLMNHIAEVISEQMKFDNSNICINEAQKRSILDELAHWLCDSQSTPVSDEKFSMWVNSLLCLLQKEPTGVQNLHLKPENVSCQTFSNAENELNSHYDSCESLPGEKVPSFESRAGFGHGGTLRSSMSRVDSLGELLLHLPRIASLPQFLANVSEDSESHSGG